MCYFRRILFLMNEILNEIKVEKNSLTTFMELQLLVAASISAQPVAEYSASIVVIVRPALNYD